MSQVEGGGWQGSEEGHVRVQQGDQQHGDGHGDAGAHLPRDVLESGGEWRGEDSSGESDRPLASHSLLQVDGARGDSYSLAEARDLAGQLARGLLGLGVQPGDVLAVLLPNCPEYVIAMLGASEAGMTVTTLNPAYTAGEIRGQLVNSETRFIVTSTTLLDKVREANNELSVNIIVVGDTTDSSLLSFKDLLRSRSSSLESIVGPTVDSVAVLPYSSGTTGVPKGVMLTHHNMTSQLAQICHPSFQVIKEVRRSAESAPDYQYNLQEEITICVLPMYHIFAMNVTMSGMLYKGGKLVTLPMFEPKMFLETMLTYRPTSLHLAPPLVSFLVHHPAVTQDHLASLKNVRPLHTSLLSCPALFRFWWPRLRQDRR